MNDSGFEEPVPTQLLSDILWRRRDATSLEHCRLSVVRDTYALQGVVLTTADSVPLQIHYLVLCGLDWVTRNVHVTMLQGANHRSLELHRDEFGRWFEEGRERAEFAGIADVDLQVSPSTNTLPIRRLALRVGEAAKADALWVRFPGLDLQRLPQKYTREDVTRYTYESRNGAFVADLDVTGQGVVLRYGDIWEQVRP